MQHDPIVEEVHRIREQMWDDAGGSLDRLIASLRATESQHRQRLLSTEQLAQMRQQRPSRSGTKE